MKPIVAIGDVHGLEKWRSIVDEHEDCTIVFLGDYLDPYEYITRRYGAQNETYIEGWEKKTSNLLIYKRLCKI